MADFIFTNHGSITILTPVTEAAKEWREEHLPPIGDDCQGWGDGVVIEPRYAGAILDGIRADGLSIN